MTKPLASHLDYTLPFLTICFLLFTSMVIIFFSLLLKPAYIPIHIVFLTKSHMLPGQRKGTKWAQTTPNHKTVNILGSAQ